MERMLRQSQSSGDLFRSAGTLRITAQSHAQDKGQPMAAGKPNVINQTSKVVEARSGITHMLPGELLSSKQSINGRLNFFCTFVCCHGNAVLSMTHLGLK
jgi:hypothetical protein